MRQSLEIALLKKSEKTVHTSSKVTNYAKIPNIFFWFNHLNRTSERLIINQFDSKRASEIMKVRDILSFTLKYSQVTTFSEIT